MHFRKRWRRALQHQDAPIWPFFWFRPLTQAEAIVLEALRVRRNRVR